MHDAIREHGSSPSNASFAGAKSLIPASGPRLPRSGNDPAHAFVIRETAPSRELKKHSADPDRNGAMVGP